MEPPYLAETEGLEPSEVLPSLFSRQVPNQLGELSNGGGYQIRTDIGFTPTGLANQRAHAVDAYSPYLAVCTEIESVFMA